MFLFEFSPHDLIIQFKHHSNLIITASVTFTTLAVLLGARFARAFFATGWGRQSPQPLKSKRDHRSHQVRIGLKVVVVDDLAAASIHSVRVRGVNFC